MGRVDATSLSQTIPFRKAITTIIASLRLLAAGRLAIQGRRVVIAPGQA